MTRVAQIGALVCLLVFGLFVLGCLSGIGWVRVSPDKRYVTVVVPVSEPVDEDTEWELRVLDLQTRATIPVRRFKMGQDWFAACQWSPDSQKLVFYGEERGSDPLYLFDVATRELELLPIEEVGPAVWSPDGQYLLVACRSNDASPNANETRLRLNWHRTSDWSKVHSVELPASSIGSLLEWGYVLPDEPFSAIVHLDDGNLYRVRDRVITPLTTTGDVKAFWISPQERRLRWVRARPESFLAVFERRLDTGAVKRLVLLEPNDALVHQNSAYRFSPNGERLAWEAEEQVLILTIPNKEVRWLGRKLIQKAQKASPRRDSVEIFTDVEIFTEMPTLGFDWQNDDTLLILRADLEAYTFYRLGQ
jgi:dipeptidyl aminopeptidase/acylaminoacyl peptidase